MAPKAPNEISDAQKAMAADLIARNWTHEKVAGEIGCSGKTIQRLIKKPDFQEQVRERRKDVMARYPTVEGVLQEALTATKDDGIEWRTRLEACRLLIKHLDPLANLPEPDPTPPAVEYFGDGEEAGDGAAADES
jgi:hypothetical protein